MLLGGCLTVPPHELTSDDLQKYRVVDVVVEGVQGIRSWPTEEESFLKTATVDPEMVDRMRSEPAFNFPQVTAHFQRVLNEKAKSEISDLTGSIFTGKQPVRVVVRLKEFDIPSVARRVFVDDRARIQADIDLVDAATGRLILRYDGPMVARKLVGGLATGIALAFERSDLGYSMIADYLSAYRNWLLRN